MSKQSKHYIQILVYGSRWLPNFFPFMFALLYPESLLTLIPHGKWVHCICLTIWRNCFI